MRLARTKKVALIAILAAIAFLVKWVSDFLPPMVLFLQYDPKDIVLALCGFMLGPIGGALTAVIACALEITISSTGGLGFLMNAIGSVTFVLTASLIFKIKPGFKFAAIGLVCAVLLTAAVMMPANILITPLYMNATREQVIAMLAPTLLPFNLAKGALNTVGVLLLYKPVMAGFRRVFRVTA